MRKTRKMRIDTTMSTVINESKGGGGEKKELTAVCDLSKLSRKWATIVCSVHLLSTKVGHNKMEIVNFILLQTWSHG